MFLDGRRGTVAGVFADVDGGFHLAVTLDDDPAASELVWQGRYLYFRPDEVEPLPAGRRPGRPGRERPHPRGGHRKRLPLATTRFGVEVAHRLAGRALPDGVRVEDYGIRGIHLAYDLLEGYDALVLVDAVPMGEPPGTLAVIEPEPAIGRATVSSSTPTAAPSSAVDAHTMSPDIVLATLARLGGSVDRIVIVGCQPGDLDEGMGLSPAVPAAVDDAAV